MKNKTLSCVGLIFLVIIALFFMARAGTFGESLKNLVASSASTTSLSSKPVFTPSNDAPIAPLQGNQKILVRTVNFKDLKPFTESEITEANNILRKQTPSYMEEEEGGKAGIFDFKDEEKMSGLFLQNMQKLDLQKTVTDVVPPIVSIITPTGKSPISGYVPLTVDVTDNVGVQKVEFYLDKTLVGTSVSSPFSYLMDTTKYVNAEHILTAKAFDTVGNTSTSVDIKITISNKVGANFVPGKNLSAGAGNYSEENNGNGSSNRGGGDPFTLENIATLGVSIGDGTAPDYDSWIGGGGACDCQIAVGGKPGTLSDVVVTTVNNDIDVWNKNGTRKGGAQVGALLGYALAGDTRLLYDQDSDRFIFYSQIYDTPNNPNNPMAAIAVSKTSDPLGAWNVYRLPIFNRGYLWLGVNHEMITVTSTDAQVLAIDKNVAISGVGSCGVGCVQEWNDWIRLNLPPGQVSAPWAPALTFDKTPFGAEYLIRWTFNQASGAENTVAISQLKCTVANCASPNLFRVNWFPIGTITGLNSGINSYMQGAPQGNGNPFIYTEWASASTMSDVVFRNGTLWFASTVACRDATCPQNRFPDRSSVYFAGIDMTQVPVSPYGNGGAPLVHSERLIDDGSGSAQRMNYFFPSIAVGSCNSIGLGFNGSSSIQTPSTYVAGGWDYDPAPFLPILTHLSAQPFLGAAAGDWSGTEVDPTNESFWSAVSYPKKATGNSPRQNWQDFIQNFFVSNPTSPGIYNTHAFNWASDNINTPNPCGLSFPTNVAVDPNPLNHRMFVTDTFNNRVVVYDTSATNGGAYIAKYVIGQEDFTTKMLNSPAGSVSGKGFAGGPVGLAYDSNNSRLFVTDGGRVLIYNVAPSNMKNGLDAINVLGQADLFSDNPNRGGAPGANTFSNARGLYYDSTHDYLWVGERGNSRVMVFDVKPSTFVDGMSAVNVIGQPNFTTVGCNAVGISDKSLCAPSSNAIAIDKDPSGWKLWIGDSINNRVLRYDLQSTTGLPSGNGISANVVLGQPDFKSNLINWDSNTGKGGNPQKPYQSGLAYPYSISFDQARNFLFVGNEFNCTTETTCAPKSPAPNSVVVFETASISNGQNAKYILGEKGWNNAFIRGNLNKPGVSDCITSVVCDKTLAAPFGSTIVTVGSDTYLYVASADDNRVLKFRVNTSDLLSSTGSGNTLSASDIWGQGPH